MRESKQKKSISLDKQTFQKIFFQKVHDPYFIALFVILVVAAFLRFYNIPARYGFDYDAARDALLSIEGAHHLRFPLVGPPSSLGSFTFGPWYYYQLIIATLLFPFGYAPWISMGIFSLLTVIIMYKIGEELGDKTFGIILALLSAFSTSQIVIATGLSNPDTIPVLEALAFLIFIFFLKKDLPFSISFLWGLILGIGLSNHIQMAGIFILPIIAFLYKKKNIIYYGVSFISGVLIAFLPTLIFELTHNWQTLHSILYYFQHGSDKVVYVPNSWTIYIKEFWPAFWSETLGIPLAAGIISLIAVLISFSYLSVTKKMSKLIVLLFVAFVVNFVYLRYYNGERSIYYLYFLQPFVFIFLGYVLWFDWKLKFGKIIAAFLLATLIVLTIPQTFAQLHPTESHDIFSNYAKQLLSYSDNQPIAVYNCGKYMRNRVYGIAYILALHNKLQNFGKKLGIFDTQCSEKAYTQSKDIISHSQKISYSGTDLYIVDLSSYSEEVLEEEGWLPVTPQRVFDTITVTLDNR